MALSLDSRLRGWLHQALSASVKLNVARLEMNGIATLATLLAGASVFGVLASVKASIETFDSHTESTVAGTACQRSGGLKKMHHGCSEIGTCSAPKTRKVTRTARILLNNARSNTDGPVSVAYGHSCEKAAKSGTANNGL